MEPLKHDLGRDRIAFTWERFAESAQNGQRVSVESAISTPENRVVGDVLPEEGVRVAKGGREDISGPKVSARR